MLDIGLEVRYDGGSIKAFRRVMAHRGKVPEFRGAFDEIEKVYRRYLRDRYRKASRGGRTWRKIAESTALRKGNRKILIDTGETFKVFQPQILRTPNILKPGVRPELKVLVTRHAGNHPHTGVSFRRILNYHQSGTSRMPKRKVIVGFSRQLAKKSATILQKALDKYHKRKHG